MSVYILQRHGERTPLRKLPVSPDVDDLGLITKGGLRQAIEIGKFFRARYLGKNDFPSQFADQRFYFHSTNVDRAKQTQAGFVYGLFGSEGGPTYPNDTSAPIFDNGYTPYPAMAMLEHNDFMLLSVSLCPTSLRIDDNHRNTNADLAAFYKDNDATLQKLFSQIKTSDTGYNITELIDTLIYLNSTNQLPEGMTQADYQEYLGIFDYITTHSSAINNTDYCNTVTGLFISQMLREVAADAQKDPSNRTVLHHYAGHDWSINTIFGCLNLNPQFNPRYGSFIIVEVDLDEENNSLFSRFTSFISSLFTSNAVSTSVTSRIKFRFYSCLDPPETITNDSLTQFIPKHCPQNQEYCPFDTFQKPWAKWWPEDRRLDWMGEVCGMERTNNTTTLLVVFISLIAFFIVLLIIFLFVCFRYVRLMTPSQNNGTLNDEPPKLE